MTLQLECPTCKTTVVVVERSSAKTNLNADRSAPGSGDYAKCPKCQRVFTQTEIDALAQWM